MTVVISRRSDQDGSCSALVVIALSCTYFSVVVAVAAMAIRRQKSETLLLLLSPDDVRLNGDGTTCNGWQASASSWEAF
jgi:hypothetical protein